MIVDAGPDTCHWGFFDATLPPVAEVESGTEVTIRTVSGGPDMLPGEGFHVPPELHAIHAKGLPGRPGHILTGPVGVRGAKAGQVLQIDILDVALRQDWGYNVIRPLAGTLPLEFDTPTNHILPLDAETMTARMPWGADLSLAPFFGVMGVAPPPNWRRISTIEPRAHGGNLDCKELVAGTTLYLPVHADGALFSCGDGHGAQGDGEVCITAIETALEGRFRLTLRDDLPPKIRAETPTHWITLATHPSLNRCAEDATRDMIDLIVAAKGLTREEAYMLCSLAGDLHVTQTVNGHKGIHMMLAKTHLV